jgi:hypothetical protein
MQQPATSGTTSLPATPSLGAAVEAAHPHHRRATFVRWLRKTHGWFGLWGAVLGLTFGTSGIWLNHRAVLKLPAMAQVRANSQVALPDPVPETAEALGLWLQSALDLDEPANNVRVEKSRPVPWTEKSKGAGRRGASEAPTATPTSASASASASTTVPLMQPERWVYNFGGPSDSVQVDYWRGNRSVAVTTTSNGFMATLTNMHKGSGMSVPWILLVDTLAGSLIFLSISGVILWVQTHRRRTVGLSLFGLSVATFLTIVLSRL